MSERAKNPAHKAATVIILVVIGQAGVARAHGAEPAEDPWNSWHLAPDVALGGMLVLVLYLSGSWRLRASGGGSRLLRHLGFLAGLASIVLALASPLDALGEHNFLAHQVQHFLLRMLAPMLVMLAAPQAALVAGLPGALRRGLVAPVLESRAVRGLLGALGQPAVATALFIAALYLWQVPALHRVALLDEPVHYLMHASMLVAGLVFFWRVFDPRPAAKATGFGVRIVMLGAMIVSQILIGAYLTLKGSVLYPVYDQLGRVGAESALADETLGGIVVWIPSSMMGVLAILLVVHRWGSREALDERRRTAAGRHHPEPASRAELMEVVADRNRALALGFAAVALVLFAAALAVGVLGGVLDL